MVNRENDPEAVCRSSCSRLLFSLLLGTYWARASTLLQLAAASSAQAGTCGWRWRESTTRSLSRGGTTRAERFRERPQASKMIGTTPDPVIGAARRWPLQTDHVRQSCDQFCDQFCDHRPTLRRCLGSPVPGRVSQTTEGSEMKPHRHPHAAWRSTGSGFGVAAQRSAVSTASLPD